MAIAAKVGFIICAGRVPHKININSFRDYRKNLMMV